MHKATYEERLVCTRCTLAELHAAKKKATRTTTTEVESGTFTDYFAGDTLIAYRVDMPYHAPQTYARRL